MAKPDWITISQNSGNSGSTTVTITASTYQELIERTGQLTINSDNTSASTVVNITQLARERIYISVSPTTLTVPYTGGTYNISITSNGAWSITSYPSWITPAKLSGNGNDVVGFIINPNETLTAKTDNIVFETIDATATVAVTMEALVPVLSISPSSYIMDYSGGDFYLNIYSNYYWNITTPAWITVSESSGYGDSIITVTVSENEFLKAFTDDIVITDTVNEVRCTVTQYQPYDIDYENYDFTIEAISGGTIRIANNYNVNTFGFEYRINRGEWQSTYVTSPSSIDFEINTGDIIQFKDGNVYYDKERCRFTQLPRCIVYGNLGKFLKPNSTSGKGTLLTNLFYGTLIIDAQNLVLPDKFIGKNMFNSCTLLVNAPKVISSSATTINSECFREMFAGCTSLLTAPQLPAITLESSCYQGMFQGCTSLTTAPELPATQLASSCYESMFQGCTSLTTAPVLPASALTESYGTQLYGSCYKQMFAGCTSLTTPPELPATILAMYSCYEGMFAGCTSLTTVPELPASVVTHYCYKNMFSGCTSLTTVPYKLLQSTQLEEYCYNGMFAGCSSLTTAPELPATTLASYCYKDMFKECIFLTTAPILLATNSSTGCYDGMFNSCIRLNYITCWLDSASNTNNWVYSVAPTGTFLGKPTAGWVRESDSGVPIGWSFNGFGFVPLTLTVNEFLECSGVTVAASSDWSLTSVPSWLALSEVSGSSGVYQISVSADTFTGVTRTNNIEGGLTDNTMSATCVVTQEHTREIWLSSPESNIPASGTTLNSLVFSPFQNWVLESNVNWITFSESSGTTSRNKYQVDVVINPNDSLDFDNDRVGYISAYTQDRQYVYVVTITQDKCNGGYLNITNGSFILEKVGCQHTVIFEGSTPTSTGSTAEFFGCYDGTNYFRCGRNDTGVTFNINGCTIEMRTYDGPWGVRFLEAGHHLGGYFPTNKFKKFRLKVNDLGPLTGSNTENIYVDEYLCINGCNWNGTIINRASLSIKGISLIFVPVSGNWVTTTYTPYAVNGVLCLKDSNGNYHYPTEGSTVSYTYTPLYN